MKIYSNEMLKNKIEKQKKRQKVLNFIFYPIAIFIVLCATSIVYQKVIKKEDNINLFGYRPYIVLSGSMEPNLQVGDMVIIKQVDEAQVEVGDIITFEDENGATITHRVVDIIIKDGKKLYQTKGDNNNSCDVGLISIENIKGKYNFKIPKIGKIIAQIITPTGLMLIILIVAIGYINTSKKNDRKIARHIIRERYKKQNTI